MSVREASSLENFHQFVGEQLRSSQAANLTPEEALALWREQQETIEALHEGMDDVESGRVKPLDDFIRDFESRHRIVSHG
jgi:predicted transcriptional regulator